MRRALLVGIDAYPYPNQLAGCVKDARALDGVLRRHHDGSPNFDVKLITAPAKTVTRPSLRQSIESLFKDPADVALLYFSGHGTASNLITPDGQAYDEGVALTEILGWANDSPAGQVVVILDCCHSGAMGSVPAIGSNLAHIREGVSILTASRDTQEAVETDGASVFTSLVVAALDGGAADVMGNVTVASVYAFLDESLSSWDQRPLFKAHVAKLVPLRRTQAAVEAETLRRLPDWFPLPDAEFALDPSFEPDSPQPDPAKTAVFACLQRCRAAKLLEPVGEEHMYFAAMNSKSCRLTPLGRHYRRLAAADRV